jgi:hypothetical protein
VLPKIVHSNAQCDFAVIHTTSLKRGPRH